MAHTDFVVGMEGIYITLLTSALLTSSNANRFSAVLWIMEDSQKCNVWSHTGG